MVNYGDDFMNSPILVCITAQLNSVNLINSAKELSKKYKRDFAVVTILKKTADAKSRAKDLKILNKISKECNCDIDIIYSDTVSKSLANYVNKLKPYHIIVGSPDSSTTLFKDFVSNIYDVPISVCTDKIMYSLPTFSKEIV